MANTSELPRNRPLRVLCLGMSRTGTMSLRAAFERLGYTGIELQRRGSTQEVTGPDLEADRSLERAERCRRVAEVKLLPLRGLMHIGANRSDVAIEDRRSVVRVA